MVLIIIKSENCSYTGDLPNLRNIFPIMIVALVRRFFNICQFLSVHLDRRVTGR